jgi:hypothetical protein
MLLGCFTISAPAIVEARIYLSITAGSRVLFFPKEVFNKNPIHGRAMTYKKS